MKRLMKYSYDVCNLFGDVFLSEDKKSCALLILPDKKSTTIKSILLDAKFALACLGLSNFNKAMKREAKIKQVPPNGLLYYLWFIGVDSRHQNKGIGSLLLNQYPVATNETVISKIVSKTVAITKEEVKIEEAIFDEKKQIILIVEDNTTMLNYLFKKLTEKYNTYAALNGNDALKKLKELKTLPDLIITDIMMDKLDGYDFAKIISKNSTCSHIPFIFLPIIVCLACT